MAKSRFVRVMLPFAMTSIALVGCLDWRNQTRRAPADDAGVANPGDADMDEDAEAAVSVIEDDDGGTPARPPDGDAAAPAQDEDAEVTPDAEAGDDASAPDAGDAAGDDAGPGSCDTSACPVEYPCVGTATDFTCHGQFGDTPVPNRTPGDSLVQQKFTVDSAAGTVLDEVSGLMWQRVSAGGNYWKDASDYCATLPVAGGGWRLPSLQEFGTLTGTDTASNIDSTVFLQVGNECSYWSSTRDVLAPTPTHFAYFLRDFYYGISPHNDTEGRCVICVRTAVDHVRGTPRTRFEYLEGQTLVRDRITHLVWEADLPLGRGELSKSQADAYCAGLHVGMRDFRLPTLGELLSITDYSKSVESGRTPAMLSMRARGTWSRSRVPGQPGSADYVALMTAGWLNPLNTNDETSRSGVRCVSPE